MDHTQFEEMAASRAVWERLRDEIRRDHAEQYAAIAGAVRHGGRGVGRQATATDAGCCLIFEDPTTQQRVGPLVQFCVMRGVPRVSCRVL
jgi:hypothetical protein